MLSNIEAQVHSTREVLAWHAGAGHALLAECARLLQSSTGRIVISGMGASFFAALPGAQAMTEQGLPVLLAESSELLHFGSRSFARGDVAILISRSGGSVEVLRLAEQMRSAGTRIVALTNIDGSPLSALAEATIPVGSLADQLIAVQTYTGTALTLLLLAGQMAHGTVAAATDAALAALPQLGDFIAASLHASENWKEFLLGARPLYLLARGPALATAHEGSLLFQETAKAPAVAMSSGQFRHGPVEAVDAAFRAVVIGTPAATRALDWSLALDLRRMGADVRWLGPRAGAGALTSLVDWPEDVPSLLQPVFEVIPLQVMAYRLAWWRGVTPGDFRFASEITAAESGFPLLDGAGPATR